MSIKTQLEKRIQAKTQEISDLEGQIREAKAYLQGVQDIYRMLPKEGVAAEQALRPNSDMAKARDFLRKIGRAAHITEILTGIGREINKSSRVSVSGSLGTYARKGVIFSSHGGNTFGLLELKPGQPDESGSLEEEPPDDFGVPHEDSHSKKIG